MVMEDNKLMTRKPQLTENEALLESLRELREGPSVEGAVERLWQRVLCRAMIDYVIERQEDFRPKARLFPEALPGS